MKPLHNRWFAKYNKRVPEWLKPFRPFIEHNKHLMTRQTLIQFVATVKNDFGLNLADATNLTVALIGVFDNGGIFRQQRYIEGEKLAKKIGPTLVKQSFTLIK